MTLSIKDPTVHDLARELAERRGTTLTQAVKDALTESLQQAGPAVQTKLERLREISRRAANLPVLDSRSADEILGYLNAGMAS